MATTLFPDHRGSTHARTIAIDYSRDLEQMILAANFDSSSPAINTQHFRVIGRGVRWRETKLLKCDQAILDDQLSKLLSQQNLRHAVIEELLAFGERYPDVQAETPIICLGSVAKLYGLHCVPSLKRIGSRRELSLAVPWLSNGAYQWGGYSILVIEA